MGLILFALRILTYIGALSLSTLCIATALYHIAQLIEEYEKLAKKIIRNITLAIIVIHVLVLIFEKVNFYTIISGIISHLLYLQLIRSFPRIKLSNPIFIISCVSLAVNKYLWFNHFINETYSFDETCAYLIILVWIVPFSIIISLTYEDSLPYGATINSSGEVIVSSKPKNSNIMIQFLRFILRKKDDLTGRRWNNAKLFE